MSDLDEGSGDHRLEISELRMTRESRERDDITDVLDARGEHHQSLEPETEPSVLDGTVTPAHGE